MSKKFFSSPVIQAVSLFEGAGLDEVAKAPVADHSASTLRQSCEHPLKLNLVVGSS
jgi:hypothetical protein